MYAFPKKEEFNIQNKANNINNIPSLYVEDINNLNVNMPSPYIENVNNINTNMNQPHSLDSSFILYSEQQPANLELWDGHNHSISIFRNPRSIPIDTKNIKISLYQMVNFIKNRNIKNNREENILSIVEFRKVVWTLISAIYEGG